MSLKENPILKEYFLKEYGSEDEFNNAPEGYLRAVSLTYSFANYNIRKSMNAFAESLRQLQRN